ncbi:MAG TPA: hypothetical protein VHV31_01560 [Nitrolancea sp.]|jgi:glutathione synthase/RimK-type ligase-like ATP-grasp enzyme|nr:hypothetical protein [Nitrolancea sp.]
MTILFITNPDEDAHIFPVINELARRGHEMQIFNPGAFPLTATLTVDSSPAGPRTFIQWAEQEIDLSTVASVWYRRPGNFDLPEELLPKEAEWIKGEAAALINGIYANTDALWVSEPHNLRRADLKLLQLRLAQQLGFRIPDYTVTNDPQRARAFLDAHPDGVIAKGLWMPTIMVEDRAGMIYTHRVTPEDAEYLESVRYGPTYLQALVPKKRDIRVTVIGDQIFPTAIDSMVVEASQIDFRKADIMDLPHTVITLPEPVERACLQIVKQLGLQFGAIDLLETPDGDFVFLENNPNGQWYWVEMMTGQPMARAMADLLERGVIERGDTRTLVSPAEIPPRALRPLPVGEQTVPLPRRLATSALGADSAAADANFAATRAWLERKRGNIMLHVGDVDA